MLVLMVHRERDDTRAVITACTLTLTYIAAPDSAEHATWMNPGHQCGHRNYCPLLLSLKLAYTKSVSELSMITGPQVHRLLFWSL